MSSNADHTNLSLFFQNRRRFLDAFVIHFLRIADVMDKHDLNMIHFQTTQTGIGRFDKLRFGLLGCQSPSLTRCKDFGDNRGLIANAHLLESSPQKLFVAAILVGGSCVE